MNIDKKIATRQSYGEALVELGKENEKIVVLDADLSYSNKNKYICKRISKKIF